MKIRHIAFTYLLMYFIGYTDAQVVQIKMASGVAVTRGFDGSGIKAGPTWNTLGYVETPLWKTPFNGSASNIANANSHSCAAANTTAWGTFDTMLWSKAICLDVDTACFRHRFSLPDCGTLTSAKFSIAADDKFKAYLNGNLLGESTIGNGVVFDLTAAQMQDYLNRGQNVLAVEAYNVYASCAYFSFTAVIEIDTSSCGQCNTTSVNVTPKICEGKSYTLPSGAVVSTPGTYRDTLAAVNGCDSVVITTLEVVSKTHVDKDTLVCDQPSFVLSSGQVITQAGAYADTLTGRTGCDSIVTYHLTFNTKPVIKLLSDTALCVEDTLILQPEIINATGFSWQDNTVDQNYVVTKSGEYVLTARNTCGTSQHTTVITYEYCDSSLCKLFMPNAFSPNNDGMNDIIKPLGDCDYKYYKFKIFNRWGELVYESNSPQEGWNGRYKNAEQPVDSYGWIIEYTDQLDRPYYFKGTFTLLH